MSGMIEHFLEAERLVNETQNAGTDALQKIMQNGDAPALALAAQIQANTLAAAQVHATLALVVASRNARNPQTYPEHTRFGGVA